MDSTTKRFIKAYDPAELIAAILKHPSLHPDLRYAFGVVVTDNIASAVDTDSASVLRAMLKEYGRREKGE